jgi:hypothetical protein
MPARFTLRSGRMVVAVVSVLSVAIAAIAIITVVGAQNAATKPTVRPFVASLPPGKQTAAAVGESKTAEYATAHPGKVQIQPSETPAPLPVGIQSKYPNWWNMKQGFENEWFGSLNNVRLSVYAGSVATMKSDGGVAEDPQQGYVAVAAGTDVNGPHRDYQEYLTPTKHGAVKITAVNGTLVSLVAKDGTVFTFDLATRTFS